MDSRQDFINSWLMEQPERLQVGDVFGQLVTDIREREAIRPHVDLGNGLWANLGQQVSYFWFEDSEEIVLAMSVDVAPNCLVVNSVGKASSHRGRAPYAQDLYLAVSKVQGKSLRSDTTLSQSGLSIWKRLVHGGHKVSVYDRDNPGSTFQTFGSAEELDQFMGRRDARRYSFVLSEGLEMFDNTKSWFATRRLREMAGNL